MNWSRSSKTALLLALLVTLAAAPVAAVSISGDGVPAEKKVGSTVTTTFTLTDLYADPSYEQWTLHGETNLTGVTWTVTKFDQAGNQIGQQSYDGQSFNASIALDEGTNKVEVKVTGTVPEIENFTYTPEERFLLAGFTLFRQGGTSQDIEDYRVHHYTEDSKEAREAIESAEAAIQDAGGNEEAEQQRQRAISAYDNRNFENAISLASDAEETAKQAQESSQRNQMLLFAGIGVLALLLVAGVVYYLLSQRGPANRLQ